MRTEPGRRAPAPTDGEDAVRKPGRGLHLLVGIGAGALLGLGYSLVSRALGST